MDSEAENIQKTSNMATGAEAVTEGKSKTSEKRKNGKNKPKGKKKNTNKDGERIQRLDQLWSKKKRQKYFVPTAKAEVERELPGTSHVVLKVRRIIDKEGHETDVEVDINSGLLKEALSDIFEGVEGLKLNEEPPIASPQLLFHAREGLEEKVVEEEKKDNPNKAFIDEVKVALQFVNEDFGQQIETLKSLTAHDEITYPLLWTLFAPNTTVYTKENLLREDQLLNLESASYEVRCNGSKYLGLTCQYLKHDGEKFGWAENDFDIDAFTGARKVQNLPFYPLSRHKQSEAIRNKLIPRGRRYLELQKATFQEYSGPAITENREVFVGSEYKKFNIYVSGRAMLDATTFQQQNENTDLLKPTVLTETLSTELTDDEVIFCDHQVAGFGFQQKRWLLFAISRMFPVVWNSNAFSKLVMDTRKRDLIHALVRSHRKGPESFDDIVSGKGRGLVGLLSGSPGVGKTLTAEVIAEVTRRPLYILSAGEMGTHVYDVERKLDMVLEVTRQWGCVLLIDEADVFLQERDDMSLDRNALVSVFLRRLEYFQGVLIMTTNRKRTIDAAFESRIHFKLHYPDLTPMSRLAIWKNCFESIPKDVDKAEVDEKELNELARLELNGRQIKNVVACAVSIASENQTKLSIEGIKTVLDLVIDTDNGFEHLYQ